MNVKKWNKAEQRFDDREIQTTNVWQFSTLTVVMIVPPVSSDSWTIYLCDPKDHSN